MARPRKVGLDYFSLQCDLDEKFDAMETQFRNDGFAVAIKCYQVAYKNGTGEINWKDPLVRATLIKRCNVSQNLLEEILSFAAEIRLFDPKKWARGIITSHGIKKQLDFIESERTKARERFSAKNSRETPVLRNSSANNPRRMPQRKGKEIKLSLKETRERATDAEAPRAAHDGGAAPSPEAVRAILAKAGF